MQFSTVKKAARLVLFTFLVGCLALLFTNGQASAATYQAAAPANVNQSLDGVAGCADWSDANGGACYYWAVTIPVIPVGCTDWDAQDQVCTAWVNYVIYPGVPTYVYGARYDCTSWNSKHHVCTHWKVNHNDFYRKEIHGHHYKNNDDN
jgi:hypothetical protein